MLKLCRRKSRSFITIWIIVGKIKIIIKLKCKTYWQI